MAPLTEPGASPPGSDRETNRRTTVTALLGAVVLPTVLVVGIFAAPFLRDPWTLPFGRDTLGYLWRSSVVHDLGLPALAGEGGGLDDRPGHAIVVSVLRSLSATDALTSAWIAPGVMAAAIALAAGSLMVDALGARRRDALFAAVGLGASAYVAWTAVGYASNLMLDAVAVALAVVLILAMRGSRGVVAASAILLGAGAAIHWMFAIVLVVVFGMVVLAYELVPRRLVEREGVGAPRHPRLPSVALLAGIGAGAIALLLAPDLPRRIPSVDTSHIERFNSLRLAGFALPIVVPMALLGVGLGLADRRRRWGVVALAFWAGIAPASLFAWSVLNVPVPPYRWIGFALGLPFLAALSGPWLRERLQGRGRTVRAVGTLLAFVPGVALAVMGAAVWWSQEPRTQANEWAEIGTLAAYLEAESVRPGTPIALSISPKKKVEPIDPLRAGLPGTRALDTTTLRLAYPEDLERLLVLAPGAVVVQLESYRAIPPPSGSVLGPGVWLLQGPEPAAPVQPGVTPRAPEPATFIALSLSWLGILGIAGLGYAGLLGLPALGRVALAPAFGLASLVLAGEVAGRIGIRPAGPGAIGLIIISSGVGWALSAQAGFRAHRATPAL